MKKLSLAALLCAGALAAHASQTTEWKMMDGTMADLLQNGYRLVSVTESKPSESQRQTDFYLQKDHSLVRCFELQYGSGAMTFQCGQLVKPFNQ